MGKTSISKSFISFASISSKEVSKYTPTQGMEISEKVQKITPSGDHVSPLQLWDIGGTALDNRNLLNAIVLADVILFVYDITHLGSFNKLQTMLHKIRAIYGLKPAIKAAKNAKKDIRMPYIALIANKMDLEAERVIPQSQHDEFYERGQFNSTFMASIQRGDQMRNWLTATLSDLMGIKGAQNKKVEKPVKRSNSLVKEIKNEIKIARQIRDGNEDKSFCSIM